MPPPSGRHANQRQPHSPKTKNSISFSNSVSSFSSIPIWYQRLNICPKWSPIGGQRHQHPAERSASCPPRSRTARDGQTHLQGLRVLKPVPGPLHRVLQHGPAGQVGGDLLNLLQRCGQAGQRLPGPGERRGASVSVGTRPFPGVCRRTVRLAGPFLKRQQLQTSR